MNFSEQAPSKQWAALKYQGETVAEVWFKPDGQAFALSFRIPSQSFQIPGMDQRLTVENLLKAVSLAPEEVESWRLGGVSHSGLNGSNAELRSPLPPPPGISYLSIQVDLKPPAQPSAPDEGGGSEISSEQWQELEARWKAIEGLEVTVDTLRMRTDTLRADMEASLNTTLSADEKVHALNADVAQWNKAKSRIRYTIPKAKEFIHRATWALGVPERKKLAELFKNPVRPVISLAQMEKLRDQLDYLRKSRQVLSSQGVTVNQECQTVLAQVQGALRTVQNDAAANARKKMTSSRSRGRLF
ncbi:MAG: hypothetical protein ACJ8FY_28810 [Gemmataceae bacterium]